MFQIRLKELRENLGYSQYTFAKAFGISQSAVASWESGNKEPRNYATTKRLADFFGVSVDYLLGLTDDPAPPDTKKAAGDMASDDFTYAMHSKSPLLSDRNKSILLNLADQFIGDIEAEEGGDKK